MSLLTQESLLKTLVEKSIKPGILFHSGAMSIQWQLFQCYVRMQIKPSMSVLKSYWSGQSIFPIKHQVEEYITRPSLQSTKC